MPPCDLCTGYEPFAQQATDLLGHNPHDNMTAAATASPIAQVRMIKRLLFFIGHGDSDQIVPIDQSERFIAALHAHHIPAEFCVLPGVGHDSPAMYGDHRLQNNVLSFIRRCDGTSHQTLGI